MPPDLVTIGIVGGGFALYGYASALENVIHERVLCLKPRSGLSDRQKQLGGNAEWVDSLDELSQRSTTLILAVPPGVQLSMLQHMYDLGRRFDRLILEKPIAPTPDGARLALRLAHDLAGSVTVGYLFLYTDWFAQLHRSALRDLRISWSFRRSTAPSTWKADRAQGGGILAFFSIHLLPVCHALGFTVVQQASIGEAGTLFGLVCTNPSSGKVLTIAVNSAADTCAFEIHDEGDRALYAAEGPFGPPIVTPSFDYRTAFIDRMLRAELPLSPEKLSQSVAGSIDIWARIEEMVPA